MKQIKKTRMHNFFLHNSVYNFLGCLFLFLTNPSMGNDSVWGPFRGANTSINITEKDISDFSDTGGNLLRISCHHDPLIARQLPYSINRPAFKKLDDILTWAELYNIKIIIDPHSVPCTEKRTTTKSSDIFWSSELCKKSYIAMWSAIASRYASHGPVIAGFDLLNEPKITYGKDPLSFNNWNALIKDLIMEIRKYDLTHTIIIEPPTGFDADGNHIDPFSAFNYLDPPMDDNAVYSPHLYKPGQFTHQGVSGRKKIVKYPGKIGYRYWDKQSLEDLMKPALNYQHKYNVPIFIGEFSAVRWADRDANHYLKDSIEIFEKNSWSWAYHAWRESHFWDPEIVGTKKTDRKRSESAPRMKLLKNYFKLNE